MPRPQIYPHSLTGRTIRLLTIEPGDVDSPLQCSLRETPLDETPTPYYALSYCWGTNDFSVEMTCNSLPFRITPNLHSALAEYRRRNTSEPLWVDAVCINQSDIPERTSQVRMMQDIYSNATRVVVWLGEAEATDEKALEVLRAIHAPWATWRDPKTGTEYPLYTGGTVASHDADLAARVPDAHFDALAAFLLKPWFSRMWIVQELVCSKEHTVWCGASTLNEGFPILEAAARLLTMHNCNGKTQLATITVKDEEAEGVGRSKLMCAGRLWGFKSLKEFGQNGILWYLLITRCFYSTDPRDKIFALVGLANDVSEEFVDYSKSYEEVVQELSHMLLDGRIPTTSSSILDLWSCITRDEDDDLSGPSWVVDWLKLRDSLYTPLMSQYQSEHPTIHRRPEIAFLKLVEDQPATLDSTSSSSLPGQSALHVRGTVFDTITHIVPSPTVMRQLVPQSDFLSFQHLPSYHRWLDDATNMAATTMNDPDAIYQATGESLYDAFWRTLCCNRSGEHPPEPPTSDSSYLSWRELLRTLQEHCDVELQYRRIMKRQLRLLCSFTTLLVSALTYRFRRHKLLFVAIPFSLPPLLRLFSQGYDIGMNMVQVKLFQETMQKSTPLQIAQRDFENSHSMWTQGRQFAVTEKGLMGWIPLAARVGDHVGLFAGCRVPFVMRAFAGGFKIVGDSYLHGVMNGEGEASEGIMLPIL